MNPCEPTAPQPGRRLAMCAIGGGLATSVWPVAAAQPPLTIALVDLPPWSRSSPHGAPSGILVDMARLIAGASGQRLDIVPMPYARAMSMLRSGQVGLMLSIDSDRMNDVAVRVAPLGTSEVMVVARAGLRPASLADLGGKKVGHLRHADYDPTFVANRDVVKYEVNSYLQGMQMLQMGRLDAFLALRSAILYTLKGMRLNMDALGGSFLLHSVSLSLYMTRHGVGAAAVAKLRLACDTLHKEQTLRTLIERALAERD